MEDPQIQIEEPIETVVESVVIQESAVQEEAEKVDEKLTTSAEPAESAIVEEPKENPISQTDIVQEKIVLVSPVEEEPAESEEKDIRDSTWYLNLAHTFRGSIKKTTVVAFGLKNPAVFTGAAAIDHMIQILISLDETVTWTRSSASEILCTLVNDYWLFVPCGIQQRKGWTLKKGMKLSDFENMGSTPDGTLSRTMIEIHDDTQSLYRLTKDALILQDVSTECFDDFISWFRDEEYGIVRKEGRSGLLRKFAKSDGVFSKRTLYEWLEVHIGAFAVKEKEAIKKLFTSRHVMEKLPLISCYKLK